MEVNFLGTFAVTQAFAPVLAKNGGGAIANLIGEFATEETDDARVIDRRVLAEADAAKASLYQHFGCKDQLVASYLERRTVHARANIEAYLADTPPSQRALKFSTG